MRRLSRGARIFGSARWDLQDETDAGISIRPFVVTSINMAAIPSPVTHNSMRLLEFEILRELLAGYASSPLGRGLIARLQPSVDRIWIETQQQLTAEVREFRRVGGRFEFGGLPQVERQLEKSRIRGAAIETIEIRDIILLVDRASEWR